MRPLPASISVSAESQTLTGMQFPQWGQTLTPGHVLYSGTSEDSFDTP